MTVKELKEIINNLPDSMNVILSADQEGNSYRLLHTGDVCRCSGDGYEYEILEDPEEDREYLEEYDEFDEALEEYNDGEEALVLW